MWKKVLTAMVIVVVIMYGCKKANAQPTHHNANSTTQTNVSSVSTTDASSNTSVRVDDTFQGVPWLPVEFPLMTPEEPFFWNCALDSGAPKVRWAEVEIETALNPPRLIELGPISIGPLQWGQGFKSDLVTWSRKRPTKVANVFSIKDAPNLQPYVKIGSVGVVAKKECLEERVRAEAIRLGMSVGAELVIYQSDLNTQVEAEAGGIAALPVFGMNAPGSMTGVLGLQGGKTKKTGCPGVTADLYVKQ